ncbi:MAG: fatty acid--CoA ligase [Oxalobacter sp.]|nr:MAG: fatty acid--CoA ligase [Oxalobacter sp.]
MATRIIPSSSSAHHYPLLIKQLLAGPMTHSLHQEIVYADISRYTYRDLRERIGRLANGLEKLGVHAGQTVAIMDWDSTRYLESYFAVPMMGAVMQMVNIRLSPEQILYTLNHAKADVLLVNVEFLPLLESFADKLETVRTFVLMTDRPQPQNTSVHFATEYESMLASASANFGFPDFDENTCATTFYTTGTTGNPKGVYFTHRQIVLHTLSTATALGTTPLQGQLRRGDVYMPLTPMFHVHAWGIPYVATMLGLKQVYPGAYHPDRLLHLIQNEKISFSHCVPTILHMLLNHPHSQKIDLTGWKLVIGGSALPVAMAIAARKRGIDVYAGYGLSETCPILTIAQLTPELMAASPEEQGALRAKAGLSIPLVEMRIVDESMRPLPHDGKAIGEVVVRTPWLTQGYLHDPDASEALWEGGYLHTGDIGTIDASGFLQVTDRAKDVIKTSGEWTSSLQLENVLLQHPAVHEVAVVAESDDRWGERPVALVQLKAGHPEPVTEAALRKHVARFADHGDLSRYALLVNVVFVESLLKTSVGKTNKREMREQLSQYRQSGTKQSPLKFTSS